VSDQFVQGDTSVGPGEAPPLPQGDAKQLNDANAQAPAPEPQTQTPAQAEPPPASPAPAGQEPVSYKPATDEEKFLFAPTDNPSEPIHAGIMANGMISPPPGTEDYLQALGNALSDPTAPPSAHLMFQLVSEQMP
jgi:hypothetical protein